MGSKNTNKMNTWNRILSSIHRVAIVSGSLSMLFLAILATEVVSTELQHKSMLSSVLAASNVNMVKIRIAAARPCTPTSLAAVPVSDLARADVPRLPDALKLTYGDTSRSNYITTQSSNDIIHYYLPQLSSQCWKISAVWPDAASWVKGNAFLYIAAHDSDLGGRTAVAYAVSGQSTAVLGYTYKLAQNTDTPPPPPSQPAPVPGSTGSYSGPTGSISNPEFSGTSGSYPSQQYPTQQYQPQPYPTQQYPTQQNPTQVNQQPAQYQQAPMCSPDQYSCNNKCIPNGTPCGDYKYYKPGEGTSGQPSSYPSGYQQPIEQQPREPQQYQPGTSPQGSSQFPGEFGQGQQKQGDDQYREQFDEQRLKDMKRGLEQFSRGFKQMQRMVTRMKKTLTSCGVSIPQELQAAMDEAPKMIEAIQNAKSVDDLELLMDNIPEVGAAMQEWGPQLGDMTRLCEMLKNTNRELKNVDRRFNQLKSATKKNLTVQELVVQLEATVTEMKTAVTEAKQLAKTGDIEAAVDRIEIGFFDQMEEFSSSVQEIEMVRNLTQGLRQIKSELQKGETRIKQLERSKKIDVDTAAELRVILSDGKAKIAELQAVDRKDIETIKGLAEELWGLMETFQNTMEELGQGYYEPTIKGGNERVDVQLPDAFKFDAGGASGFQGPPQEAGF